MDTFAGTQRVYVEENEVLVGVVESVAREDLRGSWVKIETIPLAEPIGMGEVLIALGYAVLLSATAIDEETADNLLAELYKITRKGDDANSDDALSDIPF